jgi:hypothetical protein
VTTSQSWCCASPTRACLTNPRSAVRDKSEPGRLATSFWQEWGQRSAQVATSDVALRTDAPGGRGATSRLHCGWSGQPSVARLAIPMAHSWRPVGNALVCFPQVECARRNVRCGGRKAEPISARAARFVYRWPAYRACVCRPAKSRIMPANSPARSGVNGPKWSACGQMASSAFGSAR